MMKKYLFLTFLAALIFGSCENEAFGPVLLDPAGAPTITAPASTSIVITAANENDAFPTFTWTAADFGYDAGVTYSLELDKAGNNFQSPVTVGSTDRLELTGITLAKINTILAAANYPGGEEANVEFRISALLKSLASSNNGVDTVYSAPVTLKITPYEVVIIYPKIHIPGNYQGWNPADDITVIYSAKFDSKYEGFINFPNPATEFKYTEGPNWDNNWGDDGANGSLEKNGANLLAADAGVYKLFVNLNDKTHTYAKTDWGLIGSATPDGWNSDQNLIYDAVNNKLSITLDLTAGEIKFRANDDWAINFGDDGGDKKLEYGGANIPVAVAGNYTIDLLLFNAAIFKYKITKN
jgi:hypothetical protein